jgi:MoaA/NifB/PqqE/SkfB family radical SAM enzyme
MSSGSRPETADIPSVDWWITSRCNLACDFCYGPVPAADPVHLRDRIADAISAAPARAVTFCGGEPLLVKKLPQYASRQRESGKLTILNTNGELFRRRFGSTRDLPFDVVGISLDGATEEVHRRMRGDAANHAETVAAARLVASRRGRTKLKIATVLSSVNAAQVPQLARLVRDIGPDVWRIYQYSPWGPQNRGGARHEVSPSDFQAAVACASADAAPVPVQSSAVASTVGCLIVDSTGRVLRPQVAGYATIGSCLDEPIVDLWYRSPHRAEIYENKRWLVALQRNVDA